MPGRGGGYNMKMTFQPKKRQRSKVHGFRSRMSTAGGRKVLAARRLKRSESEILDNFIIGSLHSHRV